MEKDRLFEFLELGVSGYCKRYSFQCCSLCEREDCCDNTNPLVSRIKKLEDDIKLPDFDEIFCAFCMTYKDDAPAFYKEGFRKFYGFIDSYRKNSKRIDLNRVL